MALIKLRSSDGVVFEVEEKVAKSFITIRTMLEDLGIDENEEPIPLSNVKSEILGLAIAWAEHHKDDPIVEGVRTDVALPVPVSDWDAQFISKVDKATMLELVNAANYLDLMGLIHVVCQRLAEMMKGRTPREIRHIFCLRDAE